jgi:hypothetical protein
MKAHIVFVNKLASQILLADAAPALGGGEDKDKKFDVRSECFAASIICGPTQ